MEIEEEWHVGGAPSSLAFVGVADSGGAPHEGHDDHDEEGHDDHDDEGHDEHEEDEHGHEGHAHDHGTHDPHFWFDPLRVKVAVNEIAAQAFGCRPRQRERLLPERRRVWERARRA